MGINDIFVPPKDFRSREEWEADQSRKEELRERMERAREASPKDIEWRLRDAALDALRTADIQAKQHSDCAPEYDDDCQVSPGWWVPMWIFVPGGKPNGGSETKQA